MLCLGAIGNRDLNGLNGNELSLSQTSRDVRSGDYRAGCPIAYAATIIKAEWLSDHWCVDDSLNVNLVSEMRLWIKAPVGMALNGNVRHGSLQVGRLDVMLGLIG